MQGQRLRGVRETALFRLFWLRCARWIREGPAKGKGLLLTGTRTRVPGVNARSLMRPWRLVKQTEGMGQELRLWRWSP